MFSFYKIKIKIIAFIAVLCVFISRTDGRSCYLNVDKPLFTEKFGSNEIIIPNTESTIQIKENKFIEAYCGSGFRPFRTKAFSTWTFDQPNAQKLRFNCILNSIYMYLQDESWGYLLDNPTIACRDGTYSMFESQDSLVNCQNATSYVLGATLNTPIILAGLCYDLKRLNLNYVSYKLQDHAILEQTTELNSVQTNGNSLLEPINYIETFFKFPNNEYIKADISHQTESNFWLNVANYERSSIIQSNTHYKDTVDFYANFFDIIWWRSLRLGNWNRFTSLFEKRAEVANYIIYSGTSGALEIPIENDCLQNKYFQISFKGKRKTVPQFIWTYLKSTDDHIVEDFVVIAYNSPYFEYFPKNSTIICNDICDNIEWLKPMNDSRYMSTLGALYCCRPEEVVGHLDGFPWTINDILLKNEIMSTTISP